MKLVVNPMLTLYLLQYLREKNIFEIIFTSDDVLNIQYAIGKVSGSIEIKLTDYRRHCAQGY